MAQLARNGFNCAVVVQLGDHLVSRKSDMIHPSLTSTSVAEAE
jgi:hypothetical protein